MENKTSTLFRLRKDQSIDDQLLPIYLRVTITGERFKWTTQRNVAESRWSIASGRVKGFAEDAKTINTYLDLLMHKVFVYQKELILEQKEISIQSFKAKWLLADLDRTNQARTFKTNLKKEIQGLFIPSYLKAMFFPMERRLIP